MSTEKIQAAFAAAAEALSTAPRAEEVVPGDKTVLGQLGLAVETARNALAESGPSPETSELLGCLAILADQAIMDEAPGGPEAEGFLFRTVGELEGLFRRAAEGEPLDLDSVIAAARPFCPGLAEACPASGADGETAPAAEETAPAETASGPAADAAPPEHDPLQIESEEDVVIYVEFISESTEHLDRIEAHVLELETESENLDLVNDMFRCFHSMKGAAGFLGLTTINTMCHEVETMLDRIRKGTLHPDRHIVDLVLLSIDTAKKLLESLQQRLDASQSGGETEAAPLVDTGPVLEGVRAVLEGAAGAAPPAPKPTAVLPREEFDRDGAEDDEEPDAGRLGGILVTEGAIRKEDLEQALQAQKRPVGELLVEMGATTPDKIEAALEKQKSQAPTRKAPGAIKVDTVRLDALMEMVGELVIAESLIEQDDLLQREDHQHIQKNVSNLAKITRNLQELAMALRMVPLKATFQKMFRLVRDTARKTGKEVRLDLYGEDTEIDKTVIDAIADPLVHLLRNAVDHGVEPPDDRAAAGKPREGCIHLGAFHQGGNVIIEITDDGKGLHRDRILQKAEEKGLIDPAAELSDNEVYQLIFLPGFSTHDKATDISGRGVGMDVVRRNIEQLGGRVDIQSKPGEGSTFHVRLPLTMAIVDGMIVRVGSQRFIIPTLGIEESIRPEAGEVQSVVHRGEMLDVRGELVPLVRMHRLFGIQTELTDPADGLVMVVGADGRRCGLLVEDLLGQQQVVIKSLGQHLKNIRGVSGACILGDGRVGLILDVAGLIALAEKGGAALEEAAPRPKATEPEEVEAVEVVAAKAG